MRKKFLLLIMLMCALGGVTNLSQVNAQETVTIDGNVATTSDEWKIPFATYYAKSFSQSYYLSTEINKPQGSTIKEIALYISNHNSLTRNISIYLTNTTNSEFLSTNKTNVAINTTTDEVFSGDITLNSTGWFTIVLNKEFTYEGNNVLVTFLDNTNDYSKKDTKFKTFITKYVDNDDIAHYRTLYKTSFVNPSVEGTNLSNIDNTPQIQFTFVEGTGSGGDNTPTLTLTADKDAIDVDGLDPVTFTVKLGEEDVTANSSIYQVTDNGDIQLNGNTFTTNELAYHKFYATYENGTETLTSETIEIGTKISTPKFITDGDWNNTENWSAYPEFDDQDVIIRANATIPSGAIVNRTGKITIEGGSITIADGGQLISNQEGLEVTVQKEIVGYTSNENGWYTISSPVAGNFTLNNTEIISGDYDLYRYDEANYEWENQEVAENGFTTLETGRGYLYANGADQTLEFTGTMNTKAVAYELSAQGDELTGFNLIGNPFTHNIYMSQSIFNDKHIIEIEMINNGSDGDDWIKIIQNGSTLCQYTFYSKEHQINSIEVNGNVELSVHYEKDSFFGGDYNDRTKESVIVRYKDGEEIYRCDNIATVVSDSEYEKELAEIVTPFSISQPIIEGYYTLSNDGAWDVMLGASEEAIKPCQGILVKALEESTLTIKKNTTSPATKSSANPSIAINVANEKYNDIAYATFGNGVGLDKIEHRNANIPTIAIPVDDIDYAIAVLDEDINEIPVHFEAKTMGYYTISVKVQNFKSDELTLVDRMTGIETNLLLGDYTFMATTNDNPNRFFIRLANSQEPTANGNFAYVSGEELILNIEGAVEIIDMMGRIIYANDIIGDNNRIDVSAFNNAAYVVRVVNENGVKVQKIIL